MKDFLSKIEKKLFDLKKEVLKCNKKIGDANSLVWMIDSMRNSLNEEMLKTMIVKPDTPWDEIYEKTEYMWVYCNKCGWCGYVKKPNRDDPCPNCNTFDLKQHFVIVKIHCGECGDINYAVQGVLKCLKCKSTHVSAVRKMEVSRTVFGESNFEEKIKTAGFKPWPKDKKGNLIC